MSEGGRLVSHTHEEKNDVITQHLHLFSKDEIGRQRVAHQRYIQLTGEIKPVKGENENIDRQALFRTGVA